MNGNMIRVGSRESLLAVRQSELIMEQICQANPGVRTELVTMKTTGDKILDQALNQRKGFICKGAGQSPVRRKN